jgi:hypothetical protein
MSLTSAVDALVQFVAAKRTVAGGLLQGADCEEFWALDRAVFAAVVASGLEAYLPTPLPNNIGRTHLPGVVNTRGLYLFPAGCYAQWDADMQHLREQAGRRPTGKPTASLDARAVGVLAEHPDWTKKQIAAALGSNARSLAPKRCPNLAAAIKAYKDARKGRLPRGSKTADGQVEAWDDE